jgi:hypothetical protein
MFKLGNYEISRDKFGWTLAELGEGVSRKTGKPTITRRKTYYGRLVQALEVIADREAGKATAAPEIIAAWRALLEELDLRANRLEEVA